MRLIENKNERERGENGKWLKVEDLMRRLKNKANHVSEKMIEKAKAMFEGGRCISEHLKLILSTKMGMTRSSWKEWVILRLG